MEGVQRGCVMEEPEIREVLEKLKARLVAEALSSGRKCCRYASREPLEVSDYRLLERILSECRAAAVTFYSPTCPYCRAFAPIYAEAARVYGDRMPFVRVNVYESPEAAWAFQVMGVPATVVFARGRPVARLYGLVGPEELEEAVLRALREASCPIAVEQL